MCLRLTHYNKLISYNGYFLQNQEIKGMHCFDLIPTSVLFGWILKGKWNMNGRQCRVQYQQISNILPVHALSGVLLENSKRIASISIIFSKVSQQRIKTVLRCLHFVLLLLLKIFCHCWKYNSIIQYYHLLNNCWFAIPQHRTENKVFGKYTNLWIYKKYSFA